MQIRGARQDAGHNITGDHYPHPVSRPRLPGTVAGAPDCDVSPAITFQVHINQERERKERLRTRSSTILCVLRLLFRTTSSSSSLSDFGSTSSLFSSSLDSPGKLTSHAVGRRERRKAIEL